MRVRQKLAASVNGILAAVAAGCAYCINNNGAYDPITCIYFATGSSYEYWIIKQALANLGLSLGVNDIWANDMPSAPQTSNNSAPGQNISQINIQSANALSANAATAYSPAQVMQEAQSYAQDGQSAAVMTALGINVPAPAPVAVSTPTTNVPTVTIKAPVTTLPVTSGAATVVQTSPNITTIPVASGAATVDDTGTVAEPDPSTPSELSWPMIALAVGAIYFLTKKS